MKFSKCIYFAACLGLICSSCSEDITATLKAFSVYNVTATSATVKGTAVVVGDEIIESGYLLTSSTTITLKYTNCLHLVGTGTLTDFTVTFSGLSADSSYRYRIYALSADSIYYGSTISFRPVGVTIPTLLVNGSSGLSGGFFSMGKTIEQDTSARDNESPVHSVKITSFLMGETEVTNAQFLKFLISRKISSGGLGNTEDGLSKTFLYSNIHGLRYSADSSGWFIVPGFENHPVVRVTWYGANEFCRWAGGRLPTEAEWEYAARGGASPEGFLYSGSNTPNDVAWYSVNTSVMDDNHRDTQPVRTKMPNILGLYDMSGNAWEWVADWYNLYLPKLQDNPTGMNDDDADESGIIEKVRRGGGWADVSTNALRVSRRDHNTPDINLGSCGFRFAKSI
jgi:formylglycine-generating enzyme